MSGLYIHIPFCKQACSYCDFYFVTRQEQKQHFVDELLREIRSKKNTRYTNEKVRTIYIGGGTPSLLSPHQIETILLATQEIFSLELEEITLEMNPDDISKGYLSDIKSAGITRASMGVQTFDEDLLRFMNRAHSREEALSCLEELSKAGMDSFSVDLIYGNPNQTIDMLEKDIEILLGFNPPHISAYSLTIEEKTRLGKQFKLGRLIPPEDDVVAKHFDLVESRLSRAGVQQYEVSNFAQKGFEAKHNSAYWSHENYLGLGPGAHSFWWNESRVSAKRWSNKANLKVYLSEDEISDVEEEILDLQALIEERLMLSLRTIKGIQLSELKKYAYSFTQKQTHYLNQKSKEGKLILNQDNLRLTKDGLKISDSILLDLITIQ